MENRAAVLVVLFVAACGGSTASELSTPPAGPSVSCPGAVAAAVTLATTSGNVDALASDGASLYWLDGTAGTVSAVPVTGGAARVLGTFAPLREGPCGGAPGTSTLDCLAFSLAVDATSVYAMGPLGVVAIPKAGGAARSLTTFDGKTAYLMGPLVAAGGSLFTPEMQLTMEEGQPALTAVIVRLDPLTGSLSTFLDASQQVATSSILAADATNLYWLGSGTGIRATPLLGGPSAAVVSSTTLAVEGMAVMGDELAWVNRQQLGGCVCPGPMPPQLPEMVESAPLAGGAPAPLVTFPMNVDPSVSVLGDDHFAYVIEQGYGATSSLVAIASGGGAPIPLVATAEIDIATADSCNVYFASAGALERVGKPAP